MASVIGMDRSTVSRMIKRNTGSHGRHAKQYLVRLADPKAERQLKIKLKAVKFTDQLKQQSKSWLEHE